VEKLSASERQERMKKSTVEKTDRNERQDKKENPESSKSQIASIFMEKKTDDFNNGFTIVPLNTNHSNLRSVAVSAKHPYSYLFKERNPPPDQWSIPSNCDCPPGVYEFDYQLKGPREDPSGLMQQETIRLCDVQAFRNDTAEKANAKHNQITELSAGLSHPSTSSSSNRPVIYRYVDVIKNSIALLEAIHFELFMPDRRDLRFLGVQLTSVPPGVSEGDCFRVSAVDLLSDPSFAIRLADMQYPVLWEVKRMEKIPEVAVDDAEDDYFGFDDWIRVMKTQSELAYIVGRKLNTGSNEVEAINVVFPDRDIIVRERIFPSNARQPHSLVQMVTRETSSSHLYPVEPLLKEGRQKIVEESGEYHGVRTSSQRVGRAVNEVQPLSATEAARIEDRLGDFTTYGQDGDLELMDELFRLGSKYRECASRDYFDTTDMEDMKVDESIILKTLTSEKYLSPLTACRKLLDCIYSRLGGAAEPLQPELPLPQIQYDGREIQLNATQSCAFRAYADANGPRVFAIRSPPGSGKTTVAAMMAAAVVRRRKKKKKKSNWMQLLMSVQNVAVD
ncbi:hypothetical protein PENTCL1PPCAC_8089, partial [Pristionchus entomophagus]